MTLELNADAICVELRRGEDRVVFARQGVMRVALAAWLEDDRARLPRGWTSREDGTRLEMRTADRRFVLHRAEVERLLARLAVDDP